MDIDIVIPVFIGASLVLSAVMMRAMRGRAGKVRERARHLAMELGLEYLEGPEAREARGMGPDPTRAALDAIGERAPAIPPFLERLLAGFVPWTLRGELDGVPVVVYTETRSSGKNSSTWTVLRALFREPLGFELRVAREGLFTKLGKALFGLQDIELGEAGFDAAVRIKSGDPLAAKLLLDRSEARRALLELFADHPQAWVTREGARWERQGERLDAEQLRPVLARLAAAVRALTGN